MRAVLEEAHRATLQNERAATLYGVLARPGELLVVLAWDSWPVQIQKAQNHHNQKATWSTKHHGNSLSRLEACDLEGRPVFTINLSASTSPRATDEAMCYFIMDVERTMGMRGGLADKFVGLPGFCLVHLFDNGFR